MKRKGKALAVSLFLVAMAVFVFAYTYENPIPNPGEGADVIWVDTTPGAPGGEMTLQDAVAAGFISLDTKCDTAGSCPQVCIGADCKSSWPGVGSVVTSLSAGSNITLNPNPITTTGTISGKDETCATSGACPQVCIDNDCENSWPAAGHTFALGGRGSVICDNSIALAFGLCVAASSLGQASAPLGGECEVCVS